MRNQCSSWEQQFEAIIMKVNPDSKGYPQITLTNPRRVARVHRLVAEAFLETPSQDIIQECNKAGFNSALVNHKDENINNSNISNLEWCTPSYNNIYSVSSKQQKKGSDVSHAILDEYKVKEIIQLLNLKTYSQSKIAEMFGVKQITISNIWTGRSWNHVTGFTIKERSIKRKSSKVLNESLVRV